MNSLLLLLNLHILITEPMICVAFFWIDCANCWTFPMTYWIQYTMFLKQNKKKHAKFLIINQYSTIAHIQHKWARWLFRYNQQKHFAKCNKNFGLIDGVDRHLFFSLFFHIFHSIRFKNTGRTPKNSNRGNVQKYYTSMKTCVFAMSFSVGFSLWQWIRNTNNEYLATAQCTVRTVKGKHCETRGKS